MMKKLGIGLLLNFFLFSCSSPLPPPDNISVEIISVYDFSLGKEYEELNISYQWRGFLSLREVLLRNSLYPEIIIFLDPLLLMENGYAKGSHSNIRFSYFMPYLPRGLYSLTFKTEEGRSFNYDFYLEESFLRKEGRNLKGENLKGFLEEGFEVIEEEESSYIKSKNKGKILIIKGLSFDLLGPPGLEPGTNGL